MPDFRGIKKPAGRRVLRVNFAHYARKGGILSRIRIVFFVQYLVFAGGNFDQQQEE